MDGRILAATRLSIPSIGLQKRPLREPNVNKSAKTKRRTQRLATLLLLTAILCVPLGCSIPSTQKIPATLSGQANRRVSSEQARLLAIAETFKRQGRTAKAYEIYARIGSHAPESKEAAGRFAAIAAGEKHTASRKPSSMPVARRTSHPRPSEPSSESPSSDFVLNPGVDEPWELAPGRNMSTPTESPSHDRDLRVELAASMMGWKPTQKVAGDHNPTFQPKEKLQAKTDSQPRPQPAKQFATWLATSLASAGQAIRQSGGRQGARPAERPTA